MCTAGRIENAQVAIYLTHASARGHALIDRELSLPRVWVDGADRREQAGVPAAVEFATNPALATEMITGALDASVTARWVAGDEDYGGDPKLRQTLEDRGIGYVLAVACSHQIRTAAGKLHADTPAAWLPGRAWQRLSAGESSKGPRFYDWAWITIEPQDAGAPGQWWLLIRRNNATSELAYYRCWSPSPVPLRDLVRVAGRRWTIEESLCATRRLVIFPIQWGRTRREVLGSDDLPGAERLRGQQHVSEPVAGSRRMGRCAGKTRAIWRKLDLPEAQSPDDETSHPPERRLKPVLRPASALNDSRGNLRGGKRCPMRTFKEMSGPPTSRCTV